MSEARAGLVAILQHAHAGELAAGHAYRGHAASVSDPEEKAQIRRIEEEEWVHRRQVGEMLAVLGAAPDSARERKLERIGRTIAFLCRIGGWYVPMYGAGRLESHNVKEYEDAADLAPPAIPSSSRASSRWPRSSGITRRTSARRWRATGFAM